MESLSHDSHHDVPLVSRTVELTQEYILPGGEPHLPVHDGYSFLGPHNPCLQVGIPVIVLVVVLPDPCRYQTIEKGHHIILHRLVPVLLDHDTFHLNVPSS